MAMNVQVLVDHVGEQRFEEACRWAWRTAAGTGSRREDADASPEDAAMVPHELEDLVWWQGVAPWRERLALALELYRRMPCYGNLMYAKHHFSEWDDEARGYFWDECRRLIGDEDDRLADPVTYSLWCDYFEDASTVEEAWREVARVDGLTDRGVERVLDVAGPVPYPLKAPLYEQLVVDQRWHAAIFRSLLHSAFDVYGSLQEQSARLLLARLVLPEATQGLNS